MSQSAAALLTRTVQSWSLHPKLTTAVQEEGLEPTALLTRVLPQTTTDYADVLVDGRCATGTSTPGTAASICSNGSSSNAPPIYQSAAAQQERLNLLALHSLHCVLTACHVQQQQQQSSSPNSGGGGGGQPRVAEVGIILTRNESASDMLHDVLGDLCCNCNIRVVCLRDGERPPSAAFIGSDGADNAHPRPTLMIVATLSSFLSSWDWTQFLKGGGGASAAADNVPVIHVAAMGVEDIALLQSTSDENTWDAAMRELQLFAERQHGKYTLPQHQHTHHLWLCLGPLAALSPVVRSRLSRKNRRHYPLLPSAYTPSLPGIPAIGTTAPCSSTCMRYLFYHDDDDREEQLRVLLNQTHIFHRVLLMTHHKDVRHLYALVQGWGIYEPAAATSSSTAAADSDATGPRQYFMQRSDSNERQISLQLSFSRGVKPPSNSNTHHGNDAKQQQQQQHNSSSSSSAASLLITWDAYTALDMMDVDCVIQYYPPQKSLTEREWAEFIQVLHTTCDGDLEIEASLRNNSNASLLTDSAVEAKMALITQQLTTNTPFHVTRQRPQPPVVVTFLNGSDFSLCAHFMQQYYHSGGTGTLTAAAASMNYSAVTGSPGQPGVLLPSNNANNVPLLNISPHHPLFVPLVTGAEETRVHAKGRVQIKLAGMEAPPTLRNVLRAKLRMEQEGGGSSSQKQQSGGSVSPYNIVNSVMPSNTAAVMTGGGGGGGAAAPAAAAAAKDKENANSAGNSNNNNNGGGKGKGTSTNNNATTTNSNINTNTNTSSSNNNNNKKGGKKSSSVPPAPQQAAAPAAPAAASKANNNNNNNTNNEKKKAQSPASNVVAAGGSKKKK